MSSASAKADLAYAIIDTDTAPICINDCAIQSNWQSYGFDIVMAAIFDNDRERTEDEHKELPKKTGFEFKKLYRIQASESVIEVVFVQ